MRTWLALLPAALMISSSAAHAEPANPCDLLFVPEGYALNCSVHRGVEDDWRVVIRPEDSTFGALSELSLEPVDEPIEDPRTWLQSQLRFDLGGLEHVVRELSESEDSPLADERLTDSLESWLGMMQLLADWPLQSCLEPIEASGSLEDRTSELSCTWEVGPFRQHLLTRLVERDGQHYVIRVRSMNDRRCGT